MRPATPRLRLGPRLRARLGLRWRAHRRRLRARSRAALLLSLISLLVAAGLGWGLLMAWNGHETEPTAGGQSTGAEPIPPPAASAPRDATFPAPGLFRFAVLSDTHQKAEETNVPATWLWQEIAGSSPPFAFAVNTGDVTNTGDPAEFMAYRLAGSQRVSVLYHVPGNHDFRWSAWGRSLWRQHFGNVPWSFDTGGVHFVGLDSTQLLQEPGHFGRRQLEWLAGDLRRVGPETPVVLFFHHPVGGDFWYVDDQDRLFEVLAPYNVRAIFAGHVHRQMSFYQNGIAVITVPSARDGGNYLSVQVTAEPPALRVSEQFNGGNSREIITVPLEGKRPGVPVTDIQVTEDGTVLATVAGRASRVEYLIDLPEYSATRRGEWQPFSPGKPEGVWAARLPALAPGRHLVQVRSTDTEGAQWTRAAVVYVEGVTFKQLSTEEVRETGEGAGGLPEHPVGRLVWERQLGEAIQGGIAVDEARGLVVAATTGGEVWAVRMADGAPVWQIDLDRDGVISTPVIDSGRGLIYVGTADGWFYALDEATGMTRWRVGGKPVLGTPLLVEAAAAPEETGERAAVEAGGATGLLLVPAGNVLYGFDPATGEERWKFVTGGLIGGRPAVDRAAGTVYVAAGDGFVYALRAEDGALRWRQSVGKGLLYGPWASWLAVVPAGAGRPDESRLIVSTVRGVYGLDPFTGRELWQVGGGFAFSAPLLWQDAEGRPHLVMADEWGWTVDIDPDWGSLNWRTPMGERIFNSSPRSVHPDGTGSKQGLIYVAGVLGTLFCLDAHSGIIKELFHLTAGRYVYSSPVIAEVREEVEATTTPVSPTGQVRRAILFIGGQDGILRAIQIGAPLATLDSTLEVPNNSG